MKYVILVLILILAPIGTASAKNESKATLRAEIMEYVINDCYLEIVIGAKMDDSISEEDAVTLLKIIQEDDVNSQVASVISVVEGIDNKEDRQGIYTLFLEVCKANVKQTLDARN